MSDQVGNPEDRFSHNKAQLSITGERLITLPAMNMVIADIVMKTALLSLIRKMWL